MHGWCNFRERGEKLFNQLPVPILAYDAQKIFELKLTRRPNRHTPWARHLTQLLTQLYAMMTIELTLPTQAYNLKSMPLQPYS